MKKWFKKTVAVILTTVLTMSIGVPAFAEIKNNILPQTDMTQNQIAYIDSFAEKNINVVMTRNGQIKLINPTKQNIEDANKKLSDNFTPYADPWIRLPQYDRFISNKIMAATEAGLITALGGWIGGIVTAGGLIKAFAAGFGVTCFFDKDQETIYYITKYSYREVGPGSFDSNGNFIGEYHIAKVERITTNSNGTGGEWEETIRFSTTIIPTF